MAAVVNMALRAAVIEYREEALSRSTPLGVYTIQRLNWFIEELCVFHSSVLASSAV